MRILATVLSIFFASSCNNNKVLKVEEEKNQGDTSRQFSQIVMRENNSSKKIELDSFFLISKNAQKQEEDVKAIMAVKRKWPLAVQTKNRNLLDSILSSEFTYRAPTEFYNRQDYIENRVNSSFIVDTAKYENLVLQFFHETALLTYGNIVTGRDSSSKVEKWEMTWADIYLKENGIWKIGASHAIRDVKIE